MNLLSNALKFTRRGFIKISVTKQTEMRIVRKINVKSSGSHLYDSEGERYIMVKIAVHDSGCGIKTEDQGKLFKLFGKLENNDEMNPTGIGLGLTICNNILSQMGS